MKDFPPIRVITDTLITETPTQPHLRQLIYNLQDDDLNTIKFWTNSVNIYRIQYEVNENRDYQSAKLYCAIGGPSIYLKTDEAAVFGKWAIDGPYRRLIDPEIAKEIDAYWREYYNDIVKHF